MSARRILVGALVLVLGLGGCATLREPPTACRATSTAAGTVPPRVAGGLGVAPLVAGTSTCQVPPPLPTAAPPPAAGTKISTIEAAHFGFDRYDLTPQGEPRVDEAVKIMTETPSIRVAVNGYTDASGSDAYNLGLSERRARTVRDYLVARGIAADRITVHGYGKRSPVASNATAEGRAKNRRVEIVVE